MSLPPFGGKVRMGGKIRSLSTHGSPPSQSSPFEGEEVLLDGKELRKGLRAKVALVADSAACLPLELVDDFKLRVAPFQLSIDGKTYRDGVDISPSEFYARLPHCRSLPMTFAPSPASFIEAFTAGAAAAESVLCLTALSTISAAYNVALASAETARQSLPDTRIEVMDTSTAAAAEGLVVLAAARSAAGGAGIEEVKSEARRAASGVSLVAFLDTLYYLWKSGRIPGLAALAGSALRLKPLIELSNGEIRPLDRPRTRKRAMERLLAIVRQRAGGAPIRANVMHSASPDDALALKERLLSEFNCLEALVSETTPGHRFPHRPRACGGGVLR